MLCRHLDSSLYTCQSRHAVYTVKHFIFNDCQSKLISFVTSLKGVLTGHVFCTRRTKLDINSLINKMIQQDTMIPADIDKETFF